MFFHPDAVTGSADGGELEFELELLGGKQLQDEHS